MLSTCNDKTIYILWDVKVTLSDMRLLARTHDDALDDHRVRSIHSCACAYAVALCYDKVVFRTVD